MPRMMTITAWFEEDEGEPDVVPALMSLGFYDIDTELSDEDPL